MADIIAKEKQLSSAITTFISAIKSRVLALGYYLRAGTSYENNQLVRKKDIWKDTSIVYKDVSIGTSSNPDGDIPAGGGQRRALATVTYKLATRTTYLDGSYTDSTYESKSAIIYGSYISANTLGTTIKARTKIGTSTPSGTVAGAVRTASRVDIYLLANAETSVDNPTFSLGTVSDIPAGGGTSDVPVVSNIKLVHHYTSGATDNKSESTYTIYYGKAASPTSTDSTSCLFTASSLGTTIKARTKVGSAYVKVTCNGLSTEHSVEVYLQANAITSYDNPTFTLGTVTDIPAAGGTSSVPSITNVKQQRHYTSGSTSNPTLSSYTVYYGKTTGSTSTNSTDCLFTVGSLGTTVQSRTKLGNAYITIVANSKGTEKNTAVYLAANAVSNYANPTFDLGSVSDVPASGGTSAVPAISNVKQVYTYNSGSTLTVTLTTYTVYYGKATSPTSTTASSCQFTASNLGTTVKARTKLGTAYIKVVANSAGTEKNTDVYLAENRIETMDALEFTLGAIADVPASGGTSEVPTVSGVKRNYHYTSGSSQYITFNSYIIYYGKATNPTSTSSADCLFTAASRGATTGSRKKLGTAYIKVEADSVSSLKSVNVYQLANAVTAYAAPTYTLNTVADIPAAGGTSAAPTIGTVKQVYTYTSGSTSNKTISASNYTITYGKTTNPTSTNASDATYTASSLSSTLKIRTSQGPIYVKVTAHEQSTEKTLDIYQAANYITAMEPIPTTGYSTHVSYGSNIPAGGGSVSPSPHGACNYTLSSGSVVYNSTTAPFTGVSVSYTRTYAEVTDASNAFTVNASTGAVSASSMGTNVTEARSVTVNATLTTALTYTNSTYNSNFPAVTNGTRTDTLTVTQNANSVTYGIPSFTLGTISDIPAAGGTSAVPTVTNILLVVTYTSGSTETITTGATIEYKNTVNTTYSESGSNCLYTKTTLGTTLKTRTKIGTVTVKVTMNGKTKELSTDVYQAMNKITGATFYSPASGVYANYYATTTIGAGGGSVSPTTTDALEYTYSSGSTATGGADYVSGASGTFTATYTKKSGDSNITLNTTTGDVSAPDRGTTTGSARTAVITCGRTCTLSLPSSYTNTYGTFTVSSFSRDQTITQSANSVTAYAKPTFTLGSVSDVPASGGTSSAPAISNVQLVRTYSSGSTDTYTPTYTAYYGTTSSPTSTSSSAATFTGNDLGTTTKARTKLGNAYVKITANSKSTTKNTAVYQQANAVTSYANPTFTLGSVSDIPASGGDSTVPTISNVQLVRTYTSGSTETITPTYTTYYGKATGPTSTNSSSCVFSANSLGTTVKARTKLGTAYIKITANSKSTEKSTDVYQAANAITSYGNPSFTLTAPSNDVPAGGGTSAAPSVSGVTLTYYYTSGSNKSVSLSSYTVYYGTATNPTSTNSSSATFTGSNLGLTFKVRTKLGTGYVKVVVNNVGSEDSFDVYQEANYITAMEPIPVTGYSAHVTYSSTTIGAGGGSVTPSSNGACNYTFRSGTVVYNTTTAPFTGVSVSYTRSYSEQSDPSNAFTLNTSTGAVSASSRGTTTGSARSCTVRATLTTALTYTNSTYNSNFPAVANGVRNDDFTITQSANSVTYANPTFTLGNIADVSAAGGTSAVPTISSINLVATYSSGSTTNITTGYTIYYGKATNPTSTSSSSCLFTGSNLGVTTKSRTKLGTAYIKITMNSKSTTNSKDVYLEANQVEADWVDISAGPSTQYIEASGGTVYPSSDTSDYLIEEFVSYTSGEFDNLGDTYLGVDYDILFSKNGTTWYNSASSVSITGSNLGTTVKAETQLGTFYARAEGASVEYGDTYSWAVKQKANAVTAESISLSLGTISDIPASGGTSSLHSKTTTLTKTYTSGSTADSTLSSGVTYTYSKNGTNYYSSTSYGQYTGSNLNNTVKARTSLGNVYVKAAYSSSISGSLTSIASKAVYQAANEVTYGNPSFIATVPDVPASGGDSAKPTIGTVTLSTSYTSGYTGTITITSYTPYFGKSTSSMGTTSTYWTYTGSNLGTTVTTRTLLGNVYVKITANNKTNTVIASVYQEANEVVSSFVTFTPGSVSDASAAGGYCGTPSASSFLTNHVFTSRQSSSLTTGGYTTYYKNNASQTSWTTTATSARIYADSLGTTTKSRTKIGEIYIYVVDGDDYYGAESATMTVSVYLQANSVTYANPTFTLTYADVPAGGGDSAPSVTSILLKRTWTSGSSITGTPTSYTVYYGKSSSPTSTDIASATFTGSSLGTTMKVRTSLGTGYVKVTANSKSKTNSKACYQAANYITSVEACPSEGHDYHVNYSTYTISAGGGTSTPSGSGRGYYTFASGSTAYSGSTSPFTGVTATYTRTYSEYVDYYGKFDLNTSSGAVTAATRGTTTGSSWNVTVSAVLTISITYSSTYSALPKPANATLTNYPTIAQEANSATYGTPSFTIGGCANAPASGGYTGNPTISGLSLTITYTSGSTLAASTSGYTAYYGTTSSPTSTSPTSGRRYASSLGTTLLSTNKGLGYIYVKVTVNGVSKTNSKYVYLNANVVTSRTLVANPTYSDVGAYEHYAAFNLGTVLGRLTYTSGSSTNVTASNVETSFSATPDSIFTEIDNYGDWYTVYYGAKLYPNSFYTLVYVGEDAKPMRKSPATTITVTATVDGVSVSLNYTRYAYKEPSLIKSFGQWNSNYEDFTYGIFNWPTSWAKNTTYMGELRYNPAIEFTGGYSASTASANASYNTYVWFIVVDSNDGSVLVKQSDWMNSNMSNTRYKYILKITITNLSYFTSYIGNLMEVTDYGTITTNSTAQSNIKLKHEIRYNGVGTPGYTSSASLYSYSMPSIIGFTYTGYTVTYSIHN